MLAGQKGLAKVSGIPGKTRLLNLFKVVSGQVSWFLVDLPGYGFAKLSKTLKEKFEGLIQSYLQ